MNLVCFDLDGVLVDSMDWHFRSLNLAIQEVAGISLNQEEHDRYYKGLSTLKKIEKMIYHHCLPVVDANAIALAKFVHFKQLVQDNLEPSIEKIELIQQIHYEFMHTACVTNCNLLNAQLLLRSLGLLDLIHLIVTSDDVVAGKPSPEGYYKAMLNFGTMPGETLIIEDSPVGLAAAKASHAKVLAVTGPHEVTWQRIEKYL